ncbi:Alkylhydroperoxidase family enzyme, contains CxxC motif [Sphingobium faniae]|nr:Alkylhydroperoxidase family enzyme, contains CxxC motif [Sphingobium faniae]
MRIALDVRAGENPMPYLNKSYSPELVNAGMDFSKVVYERSKLPLREFEAARYRTAQINGCITCQNWRSARDVPGYLASLGRDGALGVAANGAAPDEQLYSAIDDGSLEGLSDREKLAVRFAEGMGADPHGLGENETLWQALKAHFSDEEIVDLTFSVAGFIAMGRAMHVLDLDTVCPMPGAMADAS